MLSLSDLITARETARQRLKIHNLKGATLRKDLEAAVENVQNACPHKDVKHDTKYHGGGYDYCAQTDHTWTCNTCGLLLKHETEQHHGHFG
jgi:hypothetical protein